MFVTATIICFLFLSHMAFAEDEIMNSKNSKITFILLLFDLHRYEIVLVVCLHIRNYPCIGVHYYIMFWFVLSCVSNFIDEQMVDEFV